MRLLTVSLLPCLLGALSAQNEFGIFPRNPLGLNQTCTTFTSRAPLAMDPGDILMEVPASHFSGVGHDAAGGGTLVNGVRYLTQDQNAATVESYSFVVRPQAAGGGPDRTTTIFSLGPLTLPTGVGTVAWMISPALGTPTTAIPQCNTYYMGATVTPAPGWPSDGQSFHIANYYCQANNNCGDNPAANNVPNIAWNINTASNQVLQPNQRTLRFYLLTPAAILNLGNVDPTIATTHCLATAPAPYTNTSYGVGGMWPGAQHATGPRNDGLNANVRDSASSGGFFVVFFGVDLPCPGIPLSGLANGGLYLNPALPLVPVASGSMTAAEVFVTILPPASATFARNIPLNFQAFTVGSTFTLPGNLTNRAAAVYLP